MSLPNNPSQYEVVKAIKDLENAPAQATDVQVNGVSIVSSNIANLVTESAYDASTNKIATKNDIPVIDQHYNSLSTNAQSGTAVAEAINPIVAIAEGKTKSYVIQSQSDITGTKDANDEYTNVTAITGVTIADLELGDIILIKDLNVPDYWVSQISPSISLSKMETAKVDLSDYVTLNTNQTISGLKTMTGGLVVSGRSAGGGDDEGIIIGRAANNYAGLILGSATGMRSVFYLTASNHAIWRFNNGSASFDIEHPAKAGTIALTSDIPSAITSVDGLSGGTISSDTTINGNLDAHYVKSTWLYTSAATDNASWTDVYVNNGGWLYKRSKSSFKSDLGVPSDGVVNATASTNVKRDSSGNVNAVAFNLCSVSTSTVNAKMSYDSTNECIKFTF